MKFLKILLTSLAGVCFAAAAVAQTVHPKLDSLLQRTLDSMHIVLKSKGLGAAVQLSNGAVWAGGAGISTEGLTGEEITPDHVFGIGSVNKTITAGAVLQLADAGILSLDDSLHRWLDTFPHINPNITLRQLLRHQSGIADAIGAPGYNQAISVAPDSIWALGDVIRTFTQAPIFQPGANWSYCNSNYLLLGMIIEKATGKPYYQDFRDRFLTPLGLSSFAMPPFEPFPAEIAHLWFDLNGDGKVEDAHHIFNDWNAWHSTAGPAGSYFSNASDVARWMKAFMSGSLLSPAMMTELKKTVTTTFPSGVKYGLGVMERSISGQKAWGHGGDAGYSASVWYFPEKDISIAVLNNDGLKNSWSLAPTVAALMKTYILCESQLTDNQEIGSVVSDITAFPNPFSVQITVSANLPSGGSVRYVLTDAQGKKVAETEAEGEQSVARLENLDALPEGVYFLNTVQEGRLVDKPLTLSKLK